MSFSSVFCGFRKQLHGYFGRCGQLDKLVRTLIRFYRGTGTYSCSSSPIE